MSLPKYIINFDEFTDDFKKQILGLINKELNKDLCNFLKIGDILEQIKNEISKNKYQDIVYKINNLLIKQIQGKQKIISRILNVPAIKDNYKKKFIFDKDIYITGLHINQTAWKKEDIYSLNIDKNKIIESYTKEIGEHKHFNNFLKVNANTPIFFILENNSGNSRQLLVDLEYIEEIQIEHDIEDIYNNWNVAVRMNWEGNTSADIDLYGEFEDKVIYFGNNSCDNSYLNTDCRSHIDNDNPEILSVYRNTGTLNIYVNNFNNVKLTKPIEIKIYKRQNENITLLKAYNVEINNDSFIANCIYCICSIDLSNHTITDSFKEIPLNNLRK